MLKPIALSLLVSGSGLAEAVDYKFNGFVSVVAGQVVSGEREQGTDFNGFECPCFVADYNNGALYEDGDLAFDKETRAGIQLNVNFSDSFSVVGQAVARASTEEIKLEWIYLSWELQPGWTVQAGRKRIPMYYYSEFQDVGLSYIWVRPPQALYGWEASNYNGGSLRYTGSFGNWSVTASVYGGSEEAEEVGYTRIYDTTYQDIRWENILGGDIEVSHDWFTARFIIMTSENSITELPDSGEFSEPPTEQTVMGLAMNADFGSWFVLTEMNVNERKNEAFGLDVEAPAAMAGVGWRIGSFTPFISWSRYWDKSADLDAYEPERFVDASFTLRYDVNASNAFKLQIDKLSDESIAEFVGDTTMVTLAYDMVF